jgi:hypothetical protein
VAPLVVACVLFWVCTALLVGFVLAPVAGVFVAALAVAAITPLIVFCSVALFGSRHRRGW